LPRATRVQCAIPYPHQLLGWPFDFAGSGRFLWRRGFDCICVTDHVADPRRLIGKFSELLNFTIAPDQLDEYFDMLERERRRAWQSTRCC